MSTIKQPKLLTLFHTKGKDLAENYYVVKIGTLQGELILCKKKNLRLYFCKILLQEKETCSIVLTSI